MAKKHKPAAEIRTQLPKTPTGIEGLDDITQGGLPKGRPRRIGLWQNAARHGIFDARRDRV